MKFPQKVKQAFLQAPVAIPNVMAPETNLGSGKQRGIEMDLYEFGLVVQIGGAMAIVPTTNIKLALLESTDVGTDKTKSK